MRVLFDTNVVLDFLLDREPFSSEAAFLFSVAENGGISGYLCATTITTVHYLASKAFRADQAQQHVAALLTLFEIAPVDRPVLESALGLGFVDFEDVVLHESGAHVGVQGIVTRDLRGFERASIPIHTPADLCRILQATR